MARQITARLRHVLFMFFTCETFFCFPPTFAPTFAITSPHFLLHLPRNELFPPFLHMSNNVVYFRPVLHSSPEHTWHQGVSGYTYLTILKQVSYRWGWVNCRSEIQILEATLYSLVAVGLQLSTLQVYRMLMEGRMGALWMSFSYSLFV